MDNVRRWLIPPEFSSFKDNRVANLTYTTLLLTLSLSIIGGFLGFLVNPQSLWQLVPILAIVALELCAILLLRLGHVWLASWGMSAILWGGMVVVSMLIGGLNAATVSLLAVVVMIATLTTGARGGALFSVGSIGVLSAFFYVEVTVGGIPSVLPQTMTNVYVTSVMTILATGIFLNMAMRQLEDATITTQQNERELKLALAELQTSTVSTLYMDSILQSMLDMLIVLDENLRIYTVNRALLESLGYREGELNGIPFHTLLDTPDPDLMERLGSMTGGCETEVHVTTTYQTKTGNKRSVYLSASPMQGDTAESGNLIVCVALDISDRLRVERELAEERNLLRTLIDNLPDIIYVKDEQLRYVVANSRYNERFGLPPSSRAIIGKFAVAVEPPEVVPKIEAQERAVLAGQPLINHRAQTDIQGKLRDVQITKIPLYHDEDNRVSGLVAVIRDITEQVRAEQELAHERNLLRTLLDSLPDYVHVKDTQGHYIISNRAYLNMVGAEHQSEVIGKTAAQLFGADIAASYLLDEDYIRRTGQPILGAERAGTDQAGNTIWLHTNKVPIKNEDGSLSGIVAIATDITTRKQNEERLRESEERLRTLVENAPVFIFVIDQNFDIVFFEGQGVSNLTDHSLRKALGKEMVDNKLQTTDIHIASAVTRAFNGEPVQIIVQIGILAFDVRYSPLFDNNGTVNGVIGVATDVTERVRAENALRRSEARNRALLDALPDMVLVLNREGVHVEVKAENNVDLIVPLDQIIGTRLQDILPDADVSQRYMNAIAECLKTGTPVTLEYEIDTLGGRGFFETRMVRLNEDEVIAIVRNMTDSHRAAEELRRSEQLYRTLVRNLPKIAVMLFDHDMRFLIAEGQPLIEMGYSPQDMEGKTLEEVVPPETAAVFSPHYQTALKGEVAHQELPLPDAGRVYNTTHVPIRNDDGDIYAGMVVAIDVTEDRLRAQELHQYAQALERSNRELQDFAYVASHDLQEPLRKIQAFGDRLAKRSESALDETSLDYLHRMQSAAGRMQNLIQDLLAFSRVTTRAQPFQSVNLDDVLAGVLTDLDYRIEQTNAQIHLEKLPTIEAEKLQIRQLFQNLIGNALKYIKPNTPPEICITGAILVDNPPFVRITIQDNGIGFDAQHAETIFGLFQRLHNRRQYEGTGMGLAICRKIVERHHGSITAEGIPGKGATFIITLPLQQPTLSIPSGGLNHE